MLAQILQGLFGGLGEGMQANVDNQRRTQQLGMQQKAQDFDIEQAKRKAVMEAYQTLTPGQVVDPQQASQFKALGLGGLEAQGDKIVRAKSPQDQLLELKFKEAEEEANQRSKKLAVLDQIHNAGSDFYNLPLIERLGQTRSVGLDDDVAMLPDEKVKFSPQVQAAGITTAGRIASAGAGRNPYAAQNAQVSLEKAAREAADRAAKNPITGIIDKNIWAQTYQEFKNQIGQSNSSAAVAGPTSSGPAPGTRGVVNGVAAIWDGKGWKRAE